MEGQRIEPHIFHEPHKYFWWWISWKKDDSLSKCWIRETLMEEVLYIVYALSTAKQMWKALEEGFAQDTKDRESDLSLQNCIL